MAGIADGPSSGTLPPRKHRRCHGAAVPGLVAELSSSSQLARLFGGNVAAQEYARIHDLLERARRSGEVRADADVTLIIDAFIGTALARATILDHPVDHEFGSQLADLLVDGLAPVPARDEKRRPPRRDQPSARNTT